MDLTDKRVLIAFGARDAEQWLPRYLEQLDNLDYPKSLLSYAVIEGGSVDDTRGIILDWLKDKKNVYYRQIDMPEDIPKRQRMFLSTNHYRAFVKTSMKGVDPVDYVFHCDCDVSYIPPETLKTLIALDVDIVSPYIYIDPEDDIRNPLRKKKRFRDVWGFRFLYGPHPGLQFNSNIPVYYKRNMERNPSIRADLEKRLIPMQTVGANPILVKREVYEKVWYEGIMATPGWCNKAREAGFKVWSYPDLGCYHSWEVLRYGPELIFK